MRTTLGVLLATVVLASTRTAAIVDCHDEISQLVDRASIVVIATIDSIGSRETAPCPDPEPGVFHRAEYRCGPLQTFDLHIEKRLLGSIRQNVRVTLPSRVVGLTCDDPPTIQVGARIALFLNRERDGYWVVSGVAGVFDVDEWFLAEVDTAIRGKRH